MHETRKRHRNGTAPPPRRRAFLLTDLSRRSGRDLGVGLEEEIHGNLAGWRLSIRHSGDLSPREIADLASDATIVDQLDNDQLSAAQQSCKKLISVSNQHRPELASLLVDASLAGAVAADILLRRGHRSFITAQTVNVEFMSGFVDEIAHAGLTAEAMRNAPLAASLPDTTVVAETVRHSADGQAHTIVTQIDTGASSTAGCLRIEPSVTCLALVLARWLDDDQLSLPAIPPDRVDDNAIATLPDGFDDPTIASVSSYIDAKLSRGEACKIDAIANHFSLARRTLERRFRDVAKTSIHKEITRRQVARARQHLFQPSATPATAASVAGYSNTRMLSINFRKLTNLSPRSYQQKKILPNM